VEKEEKRENLTILWMASNLQHEGLEKVLKDNETKGNTATIKEVNNDWRKLQSFMSGKT